ncbi:ABC transporter permease [Streptomyces sp. NBC_00257]|uniref:ABC transporter permease subunit n=1 Tax=unclassified Streptomyces TaxID=2593676 RepID=UPI00224DEEC2|nr:MULTISPECIES: ABC transporter permease subunit [unclassified Streptomyces]WTB60841.1 ABC transporter permease [Streptomyces sp. NBC_00826]WTH95982.1 ABC transporter permease [Streptomyces sp. NBC_00825]WTI04994.1 ABC transporter permease [Streptomyces sp. NBC_00822]MCX4870357.1 ABC transporter permease [Streptomyces sp. NBC_00906]MCX4902166.1 ABC transporter permease [Streptomyces sp. NBC_00892]
MSSNSPRAVLAAEWTKVWTVRSTGCTLLLAFVLSTGIGTLVAFNWRSDIEHVVNFDPLVAALYSVTLGQLALVVLGALLVGSEYSSGSIRTSLTAVPRRGLLYGGKVLAGTLTAFAGSTVIVVVTFLAAQAALGPYRTGLSADGVPSALAGAVVYLTLICAFSMGIATVVRSSAVAMGILLPLLFLGSQGLGNIPALKPVLRYLPDQAGLELMHIAGPSSDGRYGPGYGSGAALVILLAWTAAALISGYLVLRSRDA